MTPEQTAVAVVAWVGVALGILGAGLGILNMLFGVNLWARRKRFRVSQASLSLSLQPSIRPPLEAEQHIEGMFDLVRTSGDKDCYLMEWEFKPNKRDLDKFSALKDFSIRHQEHKPRQLTPNLAMHTGVGQRLLPELKDAPNLLPPRNWPELIKANAELGTLFHAVEKTKAIIKVEELPLGVSKPLKLQRFELRWKDGEGNWHTYHHPPPLWQRFGRDKFWGW